MPRLDSCNSRHFEWRWHRLTLAVVCLLLQLGPCQAVAASNNCSTPLSFQEEFEASAVVARVQYDDTHTFDLPCGVEYYDEDIPGFLVSRLSTTGFSSYMVLEVFKEDEGLDLQPGNNIIIVQQTEIGLRKDIPSELQSTDLSGFVAFLRPHRMCYATTTDRKGGDNLSPRSTVIQYPYPDADATYAVQGNKSNPYLLNACGSSNNVPWGSVSVDLQDFLLNGGNMEEHDKIQGVSTSKAANPTTAYGTLWIMALALAAVLL